MTESLLILCRLNLSPLSGTDSGKYKVPVLGLYALVGWRRIYLLLYLVNKCCCNILLVIALFMCVCLCTRVDVGEFFRNRSERP